MRASVWQYVEDGPDIFVNDWHHTLKMRLKGTRAYWYDEVYAMPGKNCNSEEAFWEEGPFFMRMVVKRKSHPGKVRLVSHRVNTPCRNPDSEFQL